MNIKTDEHWQFAFKFWITALLLAGAAWFTITIMPILALFLVAFLIVYIILPLVKFLTRKKIPYILSTFLAFIVIVFFIALFFYIFIPGIVDEMRFLTTYVTTDLLPFFNDFVKQMEDIDTRFDFQFSQNLTQFFTSVLEEIPQYVQRALENLSSFTIALFSGVGSVVIVFFVLFYMLIYVEKAREQITLLFPSIYHERIGYILDVINEKVGAYIRGTALKCLIVGVLTGIALSIIGLPFAIMFGFIAGLFNIILYIGPVVAAVPAVLLSFTPDTPHFIVVIIVYVAIQLIDGMILTPLLLGKAVDLNPFTIIVVILIGGQLAGIFGIIISIPIMAIGKVLFNHYYLKNLDHAQAPCVLEENDVIDED